MIDVEKNHRDQPEVKEFVILDRWNDGLPKLMYISQKLSGMTERDMVMSFAKSP